MEVALKRMGAGDDGWFANVAPDVFDAPLSPGRLAAYLGTPGHLMVLALEGDLVVGQCAAIIHRHPDKPTELYVDELGTASTHRRRGIAGALLREMLAWGRERGCAEAWLGTEPDNVAAIGLYRSAAPAEQEDMQLYLFKL